MQVVQVGSDLENAAVAAGQVFELASRLLVAPMSRVAQEYWATAVRDTAGGGGEIHRLGEDQIFSDGQGRGYFAPSERRFALQAPMPAMPEPGADDGWGAWDAWLQEHGIPVSRVTCVPLAVDLSRSLWAGGQHTTVQRLMCELSDRFTGVAELLRTQAPNSATFATEPVITLRPADEPLCAMIDVSCWACIPGQSAADGEG